VTAAADLPWPDAAAALDGGIAILPFGAFEQHGHHLPLSTDTIVAEHVARQLATRLDVVLLPAIGYGETWNNAGYPATLSLSPATVLAIALDIGRALAASHARGFVIVNGDWGNRAPLAEAAATLAEIPTLVLDYPGMDDAAAAVRNSAQAAPGLSLDHAGEIETSILLQIAPELVHPDRYTAGYPEFPDDFGTRPMQLHPFSASGVFGDPSPASAAKGTAILNATIDESERVARAFIAGIA
jgi:creatinine amidohydrolase